MIVISIVQSFGKSCDADLLHLARTCRAMYEPAMDALWSYVPGALIKLLMCLPLRIYNATLNHHDQILDERVINVRPRWCRTQAA